MLGPSALLCQNYNLPIPDGSKILGGELRIIIFALLLAVAWTGTLAMIQHSPGLRSTPGIWAGAFGLPGVVIAHWAQAYIRYDRSLTYGVMFFVNWIFYYSVIQGLVSIKRTFMA